MVSPELGSPAYPGCHTIHTHRNPEWVLTVGQLEIRRGASLGPVEATSGTRARQPKLGPAAGTSSTAAENRARWRAAPGRQPKLGPVGGRQAHRQPKLGCGGHESATGAAAEPRAWWRARARQPKLGPPQPCPAMANRAQPARTYPQLAQPGQHARNALTMLVRARENMGHEVERHHVAV
jgi:hypothetical protein